jgi:hypothetical protein
MNSTTFIKQVGILGIAMGLVTSPLALSDQLTLPAVIVTAEELASASMRSDPVNDPGDFTLPAFGSYMTANGIDGLVISPSFWSEPVSDTRDLTQPAFRGHPTSIPMMLVSPSFQSEPVNDPLLINAGI